MKLKDIFYCIRNHAKLINAEHDLEKSQLELSYIKERKKQSDREKEKLEMKLSNLHFDAEHESISLEQHINALKSTCMLYLSGNLTGKSMKQLYECIQPHLDKDGWSKYRIAQELTGINVYRVFNLEDNLGYFEGETADVQMRYLEAYHFNAVEWDLVPNSSYERAILGEIDCSTEEYLKYSEELHRETLISLGLCNKT